MVDNKKAPAKDASASDGKDYDKLFQEVEQLLLNCRALSQRAATYCNRIVGESDALGVEIKSLLQTITNCENATKAASTADPTGAALLRSLLKEARAVMTGLGPGGDLRKFCKPKNPWLVRMLLGDKINLVALRRDASQGIREEYHKFRDTSALVMLLGPLSLLAGMTWVDRSQGVPFGTGSLTPMLLTGIQVYLVWLSYFYLAMALRENVLVVNGSHIRPWWITHHYISAAASLALLGLPITSPSVHLFLRSFLLWSVFQAVVMYVQNRYQRRRMYVRIALGRNTSMDVVAGETSGGSGQLLLLYPMLFVLQIVQFCIGAGVAWRTYPALLRPEGWLENEAQDSDLRGMRGVCLIGMVFAFLAYRNFVTTLSTLLDKWRNRVKGGRPPTSAGFSRAGSLTPRGSKSSFIMARTGSVGLQRAGSAAVQQRVAAARSGGSFVVGGAAGEGSQQGAGKGLGQLQGKGSGGAKA